MRHRLSWLRALAVVLALATPAVAHDTPAISPSEAASHVGEIVVVEGVISDVGFSAPSETTFLNMGGKYPNHAFTAVIFRSAKASFPAAQSWEGKRARIRGVVKLYRGKPEIVLEEPSQLTIERQ